MPTYYETLGVSPNAPQSEIAAAYETMTEKFRPENFTTSNLLLLKAIDEAYKNLSDEKKRNAYDNKLLFGIMPTICLSKKRDSIQFYNIQDNNCDDPLLAYRNNPEQQDLLSFLRLIKNTPALKENIDFRYYHPRTLVGLPQKTNIEVIIDTVLQAKDKSFKKLFKEMEHIGNRFEQSSLTEQKKAILADFRLFCGMYAETGSRKDLVNNWIENYQQKNNGIDPLCTLSQQRRTGIFSFFNPEKTDSTVLIEEFIAQDAKSSLNPN